MNWYTFSKAISIPEHVIEQFRLLIPSIKDGIEQVSKNLEPKSLYIGKVSFQDPYTMENKELSIYTANQSSIPISLGKGTRMSYSLSKFAITIYTYISEEQVVNSFKHEYIHAVDPKTRLGIKPTMNLNPEYDAYIGAFISSMVEDLKKNPDKIPGIMDWIRSSSEKNFPYYGQIPYISFYIQESPEIRKKFKQRVYSAIRELSEELKSR